MTTTNQSPLAQLAITYNQEAKACSEAMNQSGNERNHERLKCTAADYRYVADLLWESSLHGEEGIRNLVEYLRAHLNRTVNYRFAEDRNSLLEGMADEIERTLQLEHQDEEE